MDINLFVTEQYINVIAAMSKIDKCGHGILYVIDRNNRLIGSVSDGDIRRWIIKTNDLTAEISELMNHSPKYIYENEIEKAALLRDRYPINSVPVLNRNNEVVDVILFDKGNQETKMELEAEHFEAPVVIMAGGKGARLYPYTKILPKPLIPIGDTPILERILNRFHKYGLKKFYLTVNYKKNMIKSYFNEIDPDYELVYVEEDKPLGTGGSIKLIKEHFSKPVIVANCDQLISADYKDLYDYHIKSGNIITVVSSLKNFTVPYGVLNTKENGELVNMEEKPTFSFFVNTGMYVINPETISLIPDDTLFHMTQLIDAVQEKGGKVGMYPISEDSFLDMGEFSEMKRMEEKLNVLADK